MSRYKPTQVFAAINVDRKNKKELKLIDEPEMCSMPSKDSCIQVSATSELTLLPDRCKCLISLLSRKSQVQDAKNSVQRRLDYVLQTLHNHQIPESDIHVTKVLQRQDGVYIMETEIVVHFVDFNKCQLISNFLIEKLDDSVKISTPVFYHSQQRVENLRRQASLIALKNAKQKAAEMAQFLRAHLGPVVDVKEEHCNEWEGTPDPQPDVDRLAAVQQRIQSAAIHISVKISATFELKSRKSKPTKQ